MRSYILTNWSFKPAPAPVHVAPELRGIMVCGHVHGNPNFNDGDKIESSNIANVQGRNVYTESGSHYFLVGEPSRGYAVWALDNGIKIPDSVEVLA